MSPGQRARAAIAAGKVPDLGAALQRDGETVTREAHNLETPGSNPGPATTTDATALSVVERVRAKLAAKQAAEPTPGPAAVAAAPAEPPRAREPGVTLKERLAAHDALDWLVEQGVDAVKLYDALDSRANTPAQLRPVIDQINRLKAEHEREIAALKADAERRSQEQQLADARSAANKFYEYLGANASTYSFLAAETREEQLQRAVRAAQMLQDAGEAGTAEQICAVAEDLVRRDVARYPGVSLGAAQKPAVGAGTQGTATTEPATLTGSIAAETSAPSDRPRRGTREWKDRLVRLADATVTAE